MDPEPVYLGQFGPLRHGAVVDRSIDISADLVSGENLLDVSFTVTLDEVEVAGVITSYSVDSPQVDFRITAPATPGVYNILAVFCISDGQFIPHTASLWVV